MNTDIPGYKKRADGFIINTNNGELNQYIEARESLRAHKNQTEKIEELETKLKSLDGKLDLILEKISNG